jgi:hypothetical protein
MNGLIVAVSLQPDEPVTLPPNPFSEGDLLLFMAFAVVIAGVFGYDMVRTWWETNEWKREARRRKRELR